VPAISANLRGYENSERFQPTRTPSASIESPSAERLANGFVHWILWTPRPIHIEAVARDHAGHADHRTLFITLSRIQVLQKSLRTFLGSHAIAEVACGVVLPLT